MMRKHRVAIVAMDAMEVKTSSSLSLILCQSYVVFLSYAGSFLIYL